MEKTEDPKQPAKKEDIPDDFKPDSGDSAKSALNFYYWLLFMQASKQSQL